MRLILKLIISLLLTIVPVSFGAPVPGRVDFIGLKSDTVTATIYNRGKQTASGMFLDQKNPKKHKIIAVSRDLIGTYNFGDSVLIMGADEYDGVYIVEDLMHKKWTKKIDILINPRDGLNKFYNVRIFKIQ